MKLKIITIYACLRWAWEYSHLSSRLPRNFGGHVTVRLSVPQGNQFEMGIFYFVWSLDADRRLLWSSWPSDVSYQHSVLTFKVQVKQSVTRKRQQQSWVFFFRLTFDVYAGVDNRERARARDKKKTKVIKKRSR